MRAITLALSGMLLLSACSSKASMTPTMPVLYSGDAITTSSESRYVIDGLDVQSDVPSRREAAVAAFSGGTAGAPAGAPAEPARERKAGERKVIHNGNIGIRVKDVPGTLAEVEEIAKQRGGFILNSTKDGAGSQFDSESASLMVRVPDANLQAAMDDIGALGRVYVRNLQGQDVTDQYTDLKIRLESKEKLLARYRDLLAQATNVREMLEIEQQIGRITEEIERIKGSLVYLDDRLDLATLSVTIEQRRVPGPLGAVFYGIGWGVSKLFLIR